MPPRRASIKVEPLRHGSGAATIDITKEEEIKHGPASSSSSSSSSFRSSSIRSSSSSSASASASAADAINAVLQESASVLAAGNPHPQIATKIVLHQRVADDSVAAIKERILARKRAEREVDADEVKNTETAVLELFERPALLGNRILFKMIRMIDGRKLKDEQILSEDFRLQKMMLPLTKETADTDWEICCCCFSTVVIAALGKVRMMTGIELKMSDILWDPEMNHIWEYIATIAQAEAATQKARSLAAQQGLMERKATNEVVVSTVVNLVRELPDRYFPVRGTRSRGETVSMVRGEIDPPSRKRSRLA